MFKTDAFNLRGVDHQIDVSNFGADDQHGFCLVISRHCVLKGDSLIEQENFNFFGTVGKYLKINFGVFARCAIQYRAGEVGAVAINTAHDFAGHFAELT